MTRKYIVNNNRNGITSRTTIVRGLGIEQDEKFVEVTDNSEISRKLGVIDTVNNTRPKVNQNDRTKVTPRKSILDHQREL